MLLCFSRVFGCIYVLLKYICMLHLYADIRPLAISSNHKTILTLKQISRFKNIRALLVRADLPTQTDQVFFPFKTPDQLARTAFTSDDLLLSSW
jgi:hypothetical protein